MGSFLHELQRQQALGRATTQVEVAPEPRAGLLHAARLRAAPFQVHVQFGASAWTPWMLVEPGDLDTALRVLHADLLGDVKHLLEALRPLEHADPEQRPPRAVQRILQRLLGLRSLLELAGAWQPASPGRAGGWTARAGQRISPALPWHRHGSLPVASTAWHLHDLRRWHWPRAGSDWAAQTARHVGVVALLQDVDRALLDPFPHDQATRCAQRTRIRNGRDHYLLESAPPIDRDPAAFVRRVRLALSALLEPALMCFDPDEVLGAVQGTRSGAVTLGRLLPDVAPGAAGALAASYRRSLGAGGHVTPGQGARPARAAGAMPLRRTAWTAARAGGASPLRCLAAEAAAGPLHLVMPALLQIAADGPVVCECLADRALEEVADVFSGVAALAAEQVLPLPDLSALLTGTGHLRLGRQAPSSQPLTPPVTDDPQGQAALALVPGLTEAIAALRAVSATHELTLARLTAEACSAAGITEAEFDEATTGERAFPLTGGDHALERAVVWNGGHWTIQLARHPQELRSDGRVLSHCVGWGGYAQAMHAGQARIVRVLDHDTDSGDPQPLLTLELRPGSGARWTLHQARGQHNRPPDAQEAQLLTLWADEVGVRLPVGGEVRPVPGPALHAVQRQLGVRWERLPPPPVPVAPTSDGVARAGAHRAAALLACWHPEATRVHHQGLRRIAQLVGRAHAFLEAELRRLHDEDQPWLVGTLEAGAVLYGVGPLTLPPDPRPLFAALPGGTLEPSAWTGLRARRQLDMSLDQLLLARENFEALELTTGRRPGELRLAYHRPWGEPLVTILTPELVQRAGLLGPVATDDLGAPGIAARRLPALRLLRSVLDAPLGSLARAATAVTGCAGTTLRDQLTAWADPRTPPRGRRNRATRRRSVPC
ncbi:PcfJ domain-containing protein [Deinococcus yunweiensis]|uniref:PcfJ domain-containing protein n=1 Tax=Deinococcus yunweiensis TaxID=367282 RepID=UPI00398E4EA9